jgi:glycine cleavage system H protein
VRVYPEDLKYTAEHEWVRPTTGEMVQVGITHYAQDALGDVVYVALPEPGTEVTAGQAIGEVESTKSVSDVYAPVTGTVAARNDQLSDQPDLVNSDPYGDGWMMEISCSGGASEATAELLDAPAYQELLEQTAG